MKKAWPILIISLLLVNCSVGPDYKRPEVSTGGTYKEAMGLWKTARPSDQIPRGEWWKMFQDAKLDELERQVASANPEVAASMARVDQARAIAGIKRADFYPSFGLNPAFTRERMSSTSPAYNPAVGQNYSDIQLPLDLDYELDLWGKIRRQVESASAMVQATRAEHESTLLLLQAEVARDYFYLRSLDAEIVVVQRMVESRSKSLAIMEERRNAKLESEFNVERARMELSTTRVKYTDLTGKRGKVEHALAILLGKAPAEFSMAATPLRAGSEANAEVLPEIAVGTPAELLQRRPDIADAERRVASANAQIGVATAAFFPSIRIMGLAGFESVDSSVLFDSASKWWAIGPSLHLPIFEGGRNIANLNRSEAAYLETVANYRMTVLRSFGEVEDALLALRVLKDQYANLLEATRAANHALELAHSEYKQGLISYLDVIMAEDSALNMRQQLVQCAGQRYATTVWLIKALGGGWDAKALAE